MVSFQETKISLCIFVLWIEEEREGKLFFSLIKIKLRRKCLNERKKIISICKTKKWNHLNSFGNFNNSDANTSWGIFKCSYPETME